MQLMRGSNAFSRPTFDIMEHKPRSESFVPSNKESQRRKVSPPNHLKDESWRHEMLAALQSSANPEPIRIACMKANVKGPSHFGEVFHGTLSREEVCELLSGGNGRYLVRESISSPGDHILSFSTGGNILHYKLFYDPESEKYHTESDEKTYSSLTDLMLDILNMLRVINRYSHQVNGGEKERAKKSKRPSFTKPHSFKLHHYMHPKWCDMCHNFMWGIMRQGMKCQDCGLNVHKHCVKDVETNCGRVTVEHKIKQEPKEKRRSRHSGDQGRPDELLLSLGEHVRCDYQLDCLRFLSNLRLPVSKFDLVTCMNPCYCDDCCHLRDGDTPLCKIGDPPQTYSLPLGWSRFRLNLPSDTSNQISTWNVAYYSLSPETLAIVLDEGLGVKRDSAFPDSKACIKLTPSIICADLDSQKVEYQDPDTEEYKVAQMVLQVYVKPGSFVTMGRAGNTEEIDPYFKSRDIYWVVREHNAVIPFGLLAKKMRVMCKQ